MIEQANAVADPWTMMIHSENALVAEGTVMGPGRLNLFTLFAPSVAVECPIVVETDQRVVVQAPRDLHDCEWLDCLRRVDFNSLATSFHSFLVVGDRVDRGPGLPILIINDLLTLDVIFHVAGIPKEKPEQAHH